MGVSGSYRGLACGGLQLLGQGLLSLRLPPTRMDSLEEEPLQDWAGNLGKLTAIPAQLCRDGRSAHERQPFLGGLVKDGAQLSAHHGQGEDLLGLPQPLFPTSPPLF